MAPRLSVKPAKGHGGAPLGNTNAAKGALALSEKMKVRAMPTEETAWRAAAAKVKTPFQRWIRETLNEAAK
jgi:predicted HicB family RNase H-like nuclease